MDIVSINEQSGEKLDKEKFVADKLAKAAKVHVKNNLGESKLLTIKIKWKFQNIATRVQERMMPFKKEKWQQDFGVGKYQDNSKEENIVKATSNETKVVETLKEELKLEHGDDAILVIRTTTVIKFKTKYNNKHR